MPSLTTRANTQPPEYIHNRREKASFTKTTLQSQLFHSLHPLYVHCTYLARLLHTLNPPHMYWCRQPKVFWCLTSLLFNCFCSSTQNASPFTHFVQAVEYSIWTGSIVWLLMLRFSLFCHLISQFIHYSWKNDWNPNEVLNSNFLNIFLKFLTNFFWSFSWWSNYLLIWRSYFY